MLATDGGFTLKLITSLEFNVMYPDADTFPISWFAKYLVAVTELGFTPFKEIPDTQFPVTVPEKLKEKLTRYRALAELADLVSSEELKLQSEYNSPCVNPVIFVHPLILLWVDDEEMYIEEKLWEFPLEKQKIIVNTIK